MREVELISTKCLTKDLINGYRILNGAIYFAEDGLKNYLAFQPIFRYLKTPANDIMVMEWKSKGLSTESIKPPAVLDNCLNPRLGYFSNPKF